MRFIYMILIGMVVFNGCLMLLADSFNYAADTSLDENAVNVSELYGASYGNPGNLWSGVVNNLFSIEAITALLLIFGTSGIIGKFTGGQYSLTLITGVGLFIGIISALWISTFKTINSIVGGYGSLLNGMVSIITVAIGIIIVFSIIEIFTGQQGVNQ